jgi:hypothetical protein
VLHTSLTGREPHAPYAPCSVEDLRSRGYDDWALGHVHDFEIVAQDPLIVFPGNLQGRSIREQGAKGAVLVTVEDGMISHLRLVTDSARFAELNVHVEVEDNAAAILRRVEETLDPLVEMMEGRPLALRMRIAGTSRFRNEILARAEDFRDEVQAACHRAHGDIWLEKLDLRIEAGSGTGAGAGTPGAGLLGLDGLLSMDGFPAQLFEEAEARIAEIAARLPGGSGAGDLPLGDELDVLLAEARDLLMSRAAEAG